ncbi:MAG TPA: hypothetical protein VGH29_06850, partial [Candidatus Binataceae bacterium]
AQSDVPLSGTVRAEGDAAFQIEKRKGETDRRGNCLSRRSFSRAMLALQYSPVKLSLCVGCIP